MPSTRPLAALILLCLFLPGPPAAADPCGMVPPVYTGPGPAITRIGEQRTYVFYKGGIESFVIRPGFQGKVDQFGMLIPFPTPPAIRKVDDNLFGHLAAAIDPPEVVVDLRPRPPMAAARGGRVMEMQKEGGLATGEVNVLREEAVGMYEVAVLEAGSAAALRRWMDDHGYQYPKGMDAACEDYVDDGWCFVAVKTRVGRKKAVNPRPGMRDADPELPEGFEFDGFVQGMGFRFRTPELVVPMRLSAFNAGRLQNVVYVLTDEPTRIARIPEEMVVRQIAGKDLRRNVTGLLPLRILGGTIDDLTAEHWERLKVQRDPKAANGLAAELFASDLLAARLGRLAHSFEEDEKVLLRIGERLNLRGPAIDALHHEAQAAEREAALAGALDDLGGMTLTVVDGDFPRQALAEDNLRFVAYEMPDRRNGPAFYDAKVGGPSPRQDGVRVDREDLGTRKQSTVVLVVLVCALAAFALFGYLVRSKAGAAATGFLLLALAAGGAEAQTAEELIDQLGDPSRASQAVDSLVAMGAPAVDHLVGEAIEGSSLPRRGWAIVCLSGIGGQDVDGRLREIHEDAKQPALVRTWAAAARVDLTTDLAGVVALAGLMQEFPALDRPIGIRAVGFASEGEGGPTELLRIAMTLPQLQQALASPILSLGPEKLAAAMAGAQDVNIGQMAAGYLGALAGQGQQAAVAQAVTDVYRFDPEAGKVPWGGALWVPGIQWTKEEAAPLVRELLAWLVWIDRKGLEAQRNQVVNNIRSWQLANTFGLDESWRSAQDTPSWLVVYGKALGKERIRALLEEQGVAGEARYEAALGRIGQ